MRSFLAILALAASSYAIAQPYFHPMAVTQEGIVIDCQPLAAEIGTSVLRSGGNAADAFIATTLAEYVTAYGYTSLSGPLNLLYYDAKTRRTEYLNAGMNTVSDPAGQFDHVNPGKAYLIGGAGRGLEALYKRYGNKRIPFRELVAPAASLARDGFPISSNYAYAIKLRAPLFTNAPGWQALYAPGGHPLAAGTYLYQPAFADTLDSYGAEGADYLYRGKFAQDLVATIQKYGGKLSLRDLENYRETWAKPLETTYRGFKVMSGSYRSAGGLLVLLALKTLEHAQDLGKGPHFSSDEAIFSEVFRSFMFAFQTALTHYYPYNTKLDDLTLPEAILNGTSPSDPTPQQLWAKVADASVPVPFAAAPGHDSCDPVVIDRDGNIAAGNETIYTSEWGDYGMMTDGVSLNTAWGVAPGVPPGQRAIDLLAPLMIFKDGKPVAAASFFDVSLLASAFQIAVNLMDYGMSPYDALWKPRFGSATSYQPLTVPLDQRYPTSWVDDFARQGVIFAQPKTAAGAVDPNGFPNTGDGMVIRIDRATGLRYGSATEMLTESVAAPEE